MSLLPEELWIEIVQYVDLASWNNLYKTSKVFTYMHNYRYLSRKIESRMVDSYNVNAVRDGYIYFYYHGIVSHINRYINGIRTETYGDVIGSYSVLLNNNLYVHTKHVELWNTYCKNIIVPKHTVIPNYKLLISEDTPGLEFLRHAERYTSNIFGDMQNNIYHKYLFHITNLLGCWLDAFMGYCTSCHDVLYLHQSSKLLLWPDHSDAILSDAKIYNYKLYDILRNIVHRPATL
jgi:hypothetical protein